MMKKILVTTVLATTAMVASAQVSLSGKISEWVDTTKTGVVSTTNMVMEPTSNIAFTAQEKLRSGMTARAVVETSLSGNTITGEGTQLGDRQRTVGLSSRLGSIDLGRNVHSQFLAVTSNDAFGTLYGSVAGDVHNLRGLRLDNATFVSANLGKNFSVSHDRSQDAGGATSFGAEVKFGAVKANVARFEQGVERSDVIGARSTFGATTVFYSHSDNKGAAASKGNLVGAAHRMGSMTVKASYGTTNKDVTAYALGVDYAFSKRTEVGVVYRNVDRVASANDVKQIAVGLTHRF
jgi:predicted porin